MHLKQCSACADDVLITTRTKQSLTCFKNWKINQYILD
jgi:hypothetical protein